MQLPPEDQPDTIDIGPVKGIPVFDDDDPRLEEDRALWSAARRKAQALHSTDDLLSGLRDHDWRVRHESVARGKDDPRTLPSLIAAGLSDSVWQVRDAAVMRLMVFAPAMPSRLYGGLGAIATRKYGGRRRIA